MLVVAYALAGNLNGDLTKEPIGYDDDNEPVFLNEIWPSPKEIAETVRKSVTPAMFRARYADVFTGDKSWKKIKVDSGKTYRWPTDSTYVKNPPYFEGMGTSLRRSRIFPKDASWGSSAIPSPPITSARLVPSRRIRRRANI